MKAYENLPYRRGVGIVLFNKQGLVLVAERRDRPGAWQFPQGGIQQGEEPHLTVKREMKEEIGTDNARIIAKLAEETVYDFPDWLQNRRVTRGVFKGKYRGQKQIWFACLFEGHDHDIDLSGEHEPEFPEFINWKWVELDATTSMVVDFKQPAYRQIVSGFAAVAAQIRSGAALKEV